jgi:hypothetical protein
MTTVRNKEPEHVDEQSGLTEEEEAELEERIAEIARGEWIDGDDVQRELRRRRGLA